MADRPLTTADLEKIFRESDAQGSHVGTRLRRMVDGAVRSEMPPFPRQIQVETANICNHGCSFCAYPAMQRPKKLMDRDLFRSIVTDAYALGAREIGLFAGAEPLACRWLEDYIGLCREIGYEYQYISTNGSIGDPERFRRLIDAGLNSIKFSINAGTRESYRRVHGKDDFDKVLANLEFVSGYRRQVPAFRYLGVSFVALPETAHEFDGLRDRLTPLIDEILYYPANNQSGQVVDLPLVPFSECALPFNKLHVSVEGFIKACCNDYDNLLAIDDIAGLGLLGAWHSERFRQLRRKHIDDTLDGTLCGRCIRGSRAPADPINEELLSPEVRRQPKAEPDR